MKHHARASREDLSRLSLQFSPSPDASVQSTQASDVASSIDHIDLFCSEQFKRLNLVQGIQLKCCSFISKRGHTTDGALRHPTHTVRRLSPAVESLQTEA
ncbi:MAG: hypothetical protein ACO3JV_08510 [Pseudomonadales bacterium]